MGNNGKGRDSVVNGQDGVGKGLNSVGKGYSKELIGTGLM